MASRHDVVLIEEEIGEPFPEFPGGFQGGGIASAASGGDQEHDGAGDGKSCPLDSEPLGARGIEIQRRRGIEDEMGVCLKFLWDVVAPGGMQFFD